MHLFDFQPDAVVEDCTTALNHEPHNVKALFRRAQGYKVVYYLQSYLICTFL